MAKRKTELADASRHHQYTSTSESVKTRPRKKRILDVPPPQASLPISHPSTQPQPQPPAPEHLLELTQIWDADKRTPSVVSRRAWALARNLRVEAVQRWWHRRRQTAKRAGETLLEETYELDVGTPPVLVGVKAEEQEEEGGVKGRGAGVARNTRGRAKRAKAEAQDLDMMLSSDTLVSSPPPIRKRAYIYRDSSLPTSRSMSPLPPSSPPALSSSPAPPSSSSSLQLQRKHEWCTRDDSSSGFTCSLCSSAPDSLPLAINADSSDPTAPQPAFVFPAPDDPLTPPVIPTRWCIVGRHYAIDGSFIGLCVCGPVAWGGCELEDVLCLPSSSSVKDGLCPPLIDDESHPLLLEDELGREA